MKILAIDTSTRFLSIAVTNGNDILATFRDNGELKHSDLIMPAIDKVLTASGLKLKNMDGLAISVGPGSFTGLRIGVATVKAMNMALGIPIVAVPTLDAIAHNFIGEKAALLCPAVDAKKQKVYASFYRKTHLDPRGRDGVELKRRGDYMLLAIDELLGKIKEPVLVFGDAVDIYKEDLKGNEFIAISDKEWRPKAEVVAQLGLAMFKKKQLANPDRLVPMYLHSRYCQVKGYKGK